jgi:hypothetical protein
VEGRAAVSARTGKPNRFSPSNLVDVFRISGGHSSTRFNHRYHGPLWQHATIRNDDRFTMLLSV